MATLIDDLRERIAHKDVLALLGTGVSRNATENDPVSDWRGLLEHGVCRCEEVAPGLPPGWGDRVRADIASADLDDLLCAAEKIACKLHAPNGGEYRRWLRETVGRLRVRVPGVIQALNECEIPIATTNYDDLIEQVTTAPSITWRESPRVERVLRGDEQGVIHLHGHWADPESIVLGIRSYERILADEHAQATLRALRMTHTLIFIGYGDGLADPNFGALLRWSRKVFARAEYRHFRLVRDCEVARVQALHPPEERIFAISYGKAHDDLEPFLRKLKP
jgi:hypothetical protein